MYRTILKNTFQGIPRNLIRAKCTAMQWTKSVPYELNPGWFEPIDLNPLIWTQIDLNPVELNPIDLNPPWFEPMELNPLNWTHWTEPIDLNPLNWTHGTEPTLILKHWTEPHTSPDRCTKWHWFQTEIRVKYPSVRLLPPQFLTSP